jgi:hypothetical protein
MSVFGPQYPPELQAMVNHAERFAALLTEQEIRRLPSDEDGRAWVTGRGEEVEMAVGFIVADWRAGQLTDGGAASAVSSYLRAMHAEAEQHLSLGLVPECCVGDAAVTAPHTPYDQATVPGSTSTASPGDTLVDPAAVLADSTGKPER